MILHQEASSDKWFSWNSKTKKHYHPKIKNEYEVLGPTHWNLEYNLKNGTIILAPNVLSGWQDD